MGYYITCEYCNEEFKGHLCCGCAALKHIEWKKLWMNSTVVSQKVEVSAFGTCLYYHIVKEGTPYYFLVGLYDEGSVYKMIDKERFEEVEEL